MRTLDEIVHLHGNRIELVVQQLDAPGLHAMHRILNLPVTATLPQILEQSGGRVNIVSQIANDVLLGTLQDPALLDQVRRLDLGPASHRSHVIHAVPTGSAGMVRHHHRVVGGKVREGIGGVQVEPQVVPDQDDVALDLL